MRKNYFLKKPYLAKSTSVPVESKTLIQEVDSVFNNFLGKKDIYSYRFLNVKPFHDVFHFNWIYYPIKNMRIEVRISLDPKSSKNFVGEMIRKSRILILKIGSFLYIEKIVEIVRVFVNRVIQGLKTEKRVKDCINNWTGNEEIMLDFLHAINSEDKAGVDGYLLYTNHNEKKNITVPIQIKSSEKYQKIHIKLHPKIPSVRIDCNNDILLKKLFRIVKAYEKKMIIHI